MNYSKNLEFEETPDYTYLKNLFKNLMEKNKYVHDLEFDWITEAKRKLEENKELPNKTQGQFFQKIVIKLNK